MKYIKRIILVVFLILLCSGCNYNPLDLNHTFDTVVCNYDGDKFELKVDKWTDYDGEQIQVVSNKKTYLLSANKCYMIKEK